jgi:hypothetical protein
MPNNYITPSELFLLRYCHVYGLIYSEPHAATINELAQLGYMAVKNGVCIMTGKGKQYL